MILSDDSVDGNMSLFGKYPMNKLLKSIELCVKMNRLKDGYLVDITLETFQTDFNIVWICFVNE